MSNEALQHKQQCADRTQEIARRQAVVLREIQRLDYVATPELKAQLDNLVEAYDRARTEYIEASDVCDIPVYVVPLR